MKYVAFGATNAIRDTVLQEFLNLVLWLIYVIIVCIKCVSLVMRSVSCLMKDSMPAFKTYIISEFHLNSYLKDAHW